MSSDKEYMDFLDKANQDLGGSDSKKPSQQPIDTSSVNTSIPSNLQNVEEFYVSDADEPFKPVALDWKGDGKLPSTEDFASLTGTGSKAAKIKQDEFDPQGQYDNIISLVKSAGNGDVVFFRVDLGGTRVEYYIVSVAKEKIVGLKAKAVES